MRSEVRAVDVVVMTEHLNSCTFDDVMFSNRSAGALARVPHVMRIVACGDEAYEWAFLRRAKPQTVQASRTSRTTRSLWEPYRAASRNCSYATYIH